MKPETLDSTSQTKTQGKNSDLRVLSIKDFHKRFLYQERKRIPLSVYKKIISEFLKIYFNELYFLKIPKYFFLGGQMKIVTYAPWSNIQKVNNKITNVITDRALGLFWYLRASKRMYHMVKLKKLTGSNGMIYKIEQKFKKINDKDLLPIFTMERKRAQDNKTLYRCIQI